MAAAAADETLRFDALAGWPAPEQRVEWFGEARPQQVLLDAYRSGRMHHAWLIGGPKGIGKATLAYRFARFVLAHPDPHDPAIATATDLSLPPAHPALRKVAARSHPNLLILERPFDYKKDGYKTELTVDEIRRTVAFYGTTSGEAGWRIAVVDPADDMNPNAANALLKVLEEPPPRSLFLVVSHAPGRALPTIRSRCRRLDLAPLSVEAIVAAIEANGGELPDPDDLALIARLAEGSLRRAILLVEGGGIETYRAFSRIAAQLPRTDIPAMHAFADGISGRGNDDGWTGFVDMLRAWLNRRIHREEEPETSISLSPAVQATPLERWAEVWENLATSSELSDEYNLDRKRTVLSVLMTLARATRM
ncbi:DNA polymerase III subunit delta' [soil metagenome]